MSSERAIVAEGLGKRYLIAHGERRHATLAEAALFRLTHPLHRVRREEFWALKDASFEVRRGEVLGIVGRNGAGKSTLLKLMSRITPPSEGRAVLSGRTGSLLEVGTGFLQELTGRENVFLNGAVLGMRRREIERAFDAIVEFSGVERFLDTPVKRYSSGMYVRLAFAVAAHLEPDILIVDEVLAVGDAEFQKRCLGKMSEVSRAGRTVLFVSHNMHAVLNLGTRALLVEGGRITRDGAPQAIVDAYLGAGRERRGFDPAGCERKGDGRARIVGFEVRPDPPRTGSRLEVVFDVERRDLGSDELELELGIGLETLDGAKVLEMYSRNVGARLALGAGRRRFTATLRQLPLVSGRYRLNLWVGSGPAAIDFVRHAFLLEVATGSLDGETYAENFGFPVTLPMTWRALEEERAEHEALSCELRNSTSASD
jgi:lipopolysaccharide transport system ATP-binding protein